VLAGNPEGVTTLSQPGMNGRVYLAGGLIQEGMGGYELHAYEFTGDLPLCAKPEPSQSATPSKSMTPSMSASHSAHPSETLSPEPSHSHHPEPSASQSPGGELANTGESDSGLLLTLPLVVLLAGAGVLWLGRRRGSHS
jgi:LPXTG-motif cell wall-anchored protein